MDVTEADEDGEAQEKRRRTAPDSNNEQEAHQRVEKERIEKHQKVHASHHLPHTREDTPAPPKLTTRVLSPQTPTPRHISPHQSHIHPQHPATLTHTHFPPPSPPSHEPKPLPLIKACDEREEVLNNILATDRRNAAVDLFFKVTPPLPPHAATSYCHHFLPTRSLSPYPLSPYTLSHSANTHSVHTHSVTQFIPTQSIPTQSLSSYPLSPYPLSHSVLSHSVTQSIPNQSIPTQPPRLYPLS